MALTPERIAELERLKALMQPLATEAQRKAQAIWNAEQMAKQVPGKKKGGLEKFLEPSKVKQRLYHGTKKDIKKFDSKNIGANDFGWYGRGHYLTADPGTASAYTSYDDILATGKLQNSAGHGANVMPLHVQARNPYYWPEGRKAATSKEESEALTKELLGLGHDSVIVGNKYQDPQYAKHHEVVLFDPRKIKSAIGNRGTYDINDPDITKAQGGTVNPFDYENPEHVSAVAGHAAKHKDFKQYGPQMMAEVLSTGHHQHLEDPRIQHAMRQAGHNAYHVQEKTGKTLHKMAQPVVKKAMGGQVQPSIAQMKMALNQNKFPSQSAISSIGAEEAPDMPVKAYVPPAGGQDGQLPVGGIDMSEITPGMQYMPEEQKEMQPPGQPGQDGQPPQPPMSPSAGPSSPGQQSNILQMTPQGQAMAAMQPNAVKPQMASGGPVPVQNRPFMSAGQKPYPFMAKVGGSDNMPMDNQSMDNGATTFDIDNIQELNEGGEAKYKPIAVKASEALGKHEGKHLKVTQADRTKVGEDFLGGPGFSSLQHVDPRYKDAAWGVNSIGASSKIANANKAHPEGDVLWSTLIGAPNQHSSNQMVFDMLLKKFKAAIKSGKMTPELREKFNQQLALAVDNTKKPVFEPGTNISASNFFKGLNTFDKRRVVADLMGGNKIGGKKGQIFDYDKIMQETTEPELIGAPTHAIGPRLFALNNKRSYREDLHPAFPHILHGEDLGQMFHPVPRKVMLPDFHEEIKNTKGRDVGFMDLTRNTPSQFLSEKFLTHLQKHGYKKGGKVKDAKLSDNLDTMRLALTKKKAK